MSKKKWRLQYCTSGVTNMLTLDAQKDIIQIIKKEFKHMAIGEQIVITKLKR